jgi:hypothetical protein
MKLSSNYIKRTLACLLVCAAPYISFSQQTKKFDLHFAVSSGGPKKYLKQLDSVILRNEITREEWIFDNLQAKDSIFKIEEVELGKYRVVVYHKALVIPFVYFTSCTFCRNKINFVAYTTTANKVFDKLFIGPHYENGFKQLSTDFLSALSKDEVKILKKSDNKLKVRCFITADDKLSDVVFEQTDLPEETKKLILKGFEKTKGWRAATANGKLCDDFISLLVIKIID